MLPSERSSIVRYPQNIPYYDQHPVHVEGGVDAMRSSPVRRTFCVIVLFDLILSVALWIVYIKDSEKPFKLDVTNITISVSMFDTVIGAGSRFLFLEVIYGCIKSKQIVWISISTAAFTAFIIVKIVMWKIEKLVVYVIVIFTLVICWFETIFLIQRVLTKEKAAEQALEYRKYLAEQYSISHTGSIRSFRPNDNSSQSSISDSSNLLFSTPLQTRPGSPTQTRLKEIQRQASDLKHRAWNVLQNKESWNYITGDAIKGFVTFKEAQPFQGKLFKIECLLDIPVKLLYDDMVNNVENATQWNTQASVSKRVETISDNVDIVYNVTNEALRGYISPRDFVLLRTWEVWNEHYLISTMSVNHSDYPEFPNIVRANSDVGAVMLSSAFDSSKTKCVWMINNDLRGKLFKSVVDRAMPIVLLEIIRNLKDHCLSLNTSQNV